MSYKRIINKGPLQYYYIKTSLEFEPNVVLSITAAQLKSIILEAMKNMFGEFGQAIPIDILKYHQGRKEAILRVPHSGFEKLWTALTLHGKYSDYSCAFRIHQVSAHLMALAANSRDADWLQR